MLPRDALRLRVHSVLKCIYFMDPARKAYSASQTFLKGEKKLGKILKIKRKGKWSEERDDRCLRNVLQKIQIFGYPHGQAPS